MQESFAVILGAVLIWRGVWVLLDHLDSWLFSGNNSWTAVAGILFGALLVYLADRELSDVV